jgi:hypothetical protein
MIPSPPKAPTALMFRIKYEHAMAETSGHQFFQKVLPECNAPPASRCCAFSNVSVWGSFGPAITPTLSYDASGHKVF